MINLQPKLKRRLFLWVCLAGMSLGFVAFAHAYLRPSNPTMDYVPQNIGIYDTYYYNFKESDCRACHETTMTAWRHHATEYAVRGQCATTCHIENLIILLQTQKRIVRYAMMMVHGFRLTLVMVSAIWETRIIEVDMQMLVHAPHVIHRL